MSVSRKLMSVQPVEEASAVQAEYALTMSDTDDTLVVWDIDNLIDDTNNPSTISGTYNLVHDGSTIHLNGPKRFSIEVDQDTKFVYCTGQVSDSLAVFDFSDLAGLVSSGNNPPTLSIVGTHPTLMNKPETITLDTKGSTKLLVLSGTGTGSTSTAQSNDKIMWIELPSAVSGGSWGSSDILAEYNTYAGGTIAAGTGIQGYNDGHSVDTTNHLTFLQKRGHTTNNYNGGIHLFDHSALSNGTGSTVTLDDSYYLGVHTSFSEMRKPVFYEKEQIMFFSSDTTNNGDRRDVHAMPYSYNSTTGKWEFGSKIDTLEFGPGTGQINGTMYNPVVDEDRDLLMFVAANEKFYVYDISSFQNKSVSSPTGTFPSSPTGELSLTSSNWGSNTASTTSLGSTAYDPVRKIYFYTLRDQDKFGAMSVATPSSPSVLNFRSFDNSGTDSMDRCIAVGLLP